MQKKKSNIKFAKKGLSVMVSYVLLVTFAIAIGAIVYIQLKTYIPKESFECSDGVSIFIKDYSCSSKILNLSLENNGRFDIGGYFIYGTNSSTQEIASIELSKYFEKDLGDDGIKMAPGVKIRISNIQNAFKTGDEVLQAFNYTNSNFGDIYTVELLPFMWRTIENKNRVVSCTDAKISQKITCLP